MNTLKSSPEILPKLLLTQVLTSRMPINLPAKDLAKQRMSTALDYISMARYHAVEMPAINGTYVLVKTRSIVRRHKVPSKLFNPGVLGVTEEDEGFRKVSTRSTRSRLAILLCSWQVEHQVCLDQGSCWFMEEYELMIRMSPDKGILELLIKSCID